MSANKALIVGVSGVIGNALSEHLLGKGWSVHGLSRGRTAVASGCVPLVADLTKPDPLREVLHGLDV
ncbi:MAG: NAD-dependent epimerase/dehydratase family protein, partial [Variovorax sp.]